MQLDNLNKLITLYTDKKSHPDTLLSEVENVCLSELTNTPLYPVLFKTVTNRRNYWSNKTRKASTTGRSREQFLASVKILQESIAVLLNPSVLFEEQNEY